MGLYIVLAFEKQEFATSALTQALSQSVCIPNARACEVCPKISLVLSMKFTQCLHKHDSITVSVCKLDLHHEAKWQLYFIA
jgi:hypothetical protein